LTKKGGKQGQSPERIQGTIGKKTAGQQINEGGSGKEGGRKNTERQKRINIKQRPDTASPKQNIIPSL
jgi:hypothetical protein